MIPGIQFKKITVKFKEKKEERIFNNFLSIVEFKENKFFCLTYLNQR